MEANTTEIKESVIAFKVGADRLPRFLDKTENTADALALFTFAKEVSEQEITRLTLESLKIAS